MENSIVCISIDVEWACDEVLADVVNLLDQYQIKATFFCTHKENIISDRHERSIHPNYKRNGDALNKLKLECREEYHNFTDEEIYEYVLNYTLSFCPQAIGTRSHCLFSDLRLLPLYKNFGIKYESSYFAPMVNNIFPFFKNCDILEIPIYYMDHFDITNKSTMFDLNSLTLLSSGIKVFDFHPNIIYLNASSIEHYENGRKYYHNPEELKKLSYKGRGVRSFFLDILETIREKDIQTLTLKELYNQFVGCVRKQN